jgi:cell division transport system permease protein
MSEQSNINYFRRKARRSSLTAVISITLVLFLLGLFGVLVMNAKMLSDYVKENLEVQVFINEDADPKQINDLAKQLRANPNVKKLEYISEEDAVEILTNDLGENFVDFLGYNPLLASFTLTVDAQYANTDSLERVKKSLLKNPIVKEVFYQAGVLDLLNKNIRTIAAVVGVFSLLLLLITITLINNSIRLSLYSQRFLIKSMQLVGATSWFIKKPYLIKSLLMGLISVVVSSLLLFAVVAAGDKQLPELAALRDQMLTVYIGIGLLALGLIISFLSTWIAINRYLRYKIDELY